jgi:tetrahydrodipicolinate N-succinyltransferase
MRTGMELAPGSSAPLQGAHFAVPAAALILGNGSQLSAGSNIFVRSARALTRPVELGAAAQVTLRDNVFVGYGGDVVTGISLADRQQILAANVIVSAEPSQAR